MTEPIRNYVDPMDRIRAMSHRAEDDELFHEGEWMVPIPGHPGYYLWRWHRVFSCWKNRGHLGAILCKHIQKECILKKHNDTPYYAVNIRKNKTLCKMLFHRIVLLAHKGMPPTDGMIALHGKNGRHDNSPNNLSWGTHKQNTADMARDGTKQFGESHYATKLTELDVHEIWTSLLNKEDHPTIGLRFRVGHHVIQKIATKITWSHVTRHLPELPSTRGCSKLTEDDVLHIWHLMGTGMRDPSIGKLYNLKHGVIWAIRHKRNWKKLTDTLPHWSTKIQHVQ